VNGTGERRDATIEAAVTPAPVGLIRVTVVFTVKSAGAWGPTISNLALSLAHIVRPMARPRGRPTPQY
jgi:hypothetical protein